MPNSQEPQFSKLRAAIWPIQQAELKKFLPMGMMMFLLLFNYTMLRNAKDTLLITAPACGAEVIPFMKPWTMLCAILFFFLYAKLSNVLKRATLFYTCLIPILVFFAVFPIAIYPHQECLHPAPESILALREAYPNFKWLISLYGVWSYGIFYVFCELWGVIAISLLFWQFANEITRTLEAKRFYSFFGLIGNISLILAGVFSEWLVEMTAGTPDPWEMNITYMLGAVVLSGIGVLILYTWMDRYVLTDPILYDGAVSNKSPKKKPSLMESFKQIFTSSYLGYIAILLLGYNIAMALIDVTWKSRIKAYLSDPSDYFAFMGRFSFWTGVIAILFILVTKGIVRRFGWFTGAIITPAMVLCTSTIFFAFVLFQDLLNDAIAFLGVTSIYMAVMVGSIQNILSKGTKYSLFDPTKEMAYIPLDPDLKTKGKAAVDVIGGRLGKSSGGMIEVALLTITAGSQLTIAPYLFCIVVIVCLIWILAVRNLGKLYNAKVGS